ncbi:MAG TPA: TatD family hydrolase [Spirochaetota bacterium]|jgi:TatD DNase family protein|nr:MAG: putative deoxyribonuclease YcfH [Spirochaetes bacterium ADurb.Bin133]HNZ25764.1 TatD family hydrolase [Spirochaetota bacterium]HOF00094.1 TatD family hydrolase [Spirochaetota bacterium]HOS31876.1 TatD family hydrolase [Spirochaetota bacterium]HOS54463.1 TatD family hydrolase [Spirochaetota bacterium]
MKLCDTHCHIALLYQDPIEQIKVIDDARRAGVEVIISVNTNLPDFFSSYKNIKNIQNIYHTIGLSPSEVDNPGRDWELDLKEGLSYPNVVAVGEIGLDYFHKYGDRNSQIEFFIRQLEIASNYNLPVVIHNREAGEDMKNILKSKTPHNGGILHCFSENYQFAKDMIDLGLYISFAGNLTYRNAKNLHEVALKLPIESILIETDSPFLTPHTYRGKRNQPAYLVETANFLSELRGIPAEELCEILYNNSLRAFNITYSD